ncbi:MAG: multifunctional oxoglutarate decarboxylase/oxoglutarate dehydrogenase thiamine pyrophosphate-binding subunit/dihydrolipoyllysine-residue succinyltransferase subunit [Planctomycetota bacterium]
MRIGEELALEAIEKQARVLQLINAYRVRGSLIADINPLVFDPEPHPELEMETYGLTVWDLDRTFITGGLGGKPLATLREILDILSDTYCRYVGVEYMHIADTAQKRWLQQRMEPTRNMEALPPEEQRRILEKLSAAETFEKFLHARFVGHKRFSLEGAETLIPMLDGLLNEAAAHGVRDVVIGMSHRGRLNVLANTFNKSNRQIFGEFEGIVDPESVHGSGDVKYHLGAKGEHISMRGERVRIAMPSNPSHLEAVDPVVEGMARARQDSSGEDARGRVLPVLIHGDAAFAGQGVVAETLNLSQLRGYHTGGTIHIVVNNQIGYTAGPEETRSTRYATDMAKSVGAPIFHVNGDFPETALRAVKIAFDYRNEFHRDVVVELVCYRRWGHNETDEPSFTQPLLYKAIKQHPSVRQVYGRRLVERGMMTEEEYSESVKAHEETLRRALQSFRESPPKDVSAMLCSRDECVKRDSVQEPSPPTGVALETLERIARRPTDPPADFHVHPKVARQMERRVAMLRGEVPIDWGCGEMLAFGSLLLEGISVRLAGQDSARGTFSQRHAVIVDQETGREWVPLQELGTGARFSIIDSALSEEAALGFEYGYAIGAPEALVMWEAQFGDFVNGAQIQVDQFIAASEEKWGQTSGVVLLLPHGFEGQGPEHSSARLERFLILCAQGNMTVANCTTPAQYFHLLRRHAHSMPKRPLVIMTPKSLLKRPEAGSRAQEFVEGRFEHVLDDAAVRDLKAVKRLLLCSGKVFYDLAEYRKEHGLSDTAILRVEQIYPFPKTRLEELFARYPSGLANVTWVQEEPRNMGAWSTMSPRLAELNVVARYVGRPPSAAPAAGSFLRHQAEQTALVQRAFEG